MVDTTNPPLPASAAATAAPVAPGLGAGPATAPGAIPAVAPGAPSPSPTRAVPVTLHEAALDSPSFRATVVHFAEQVDAIERWLDGYVRSASRLAHDVHALEEPINAYLSKATPALLPAEALLDHDYTLLALRRFGEASRDWWVQILAAVRRTDSILTEPVRSFLNTDMRAFATTRRSLDQSQKTFDTALTRYVSQSKTKEPSALREDAFAVFETRKAYLKSCMEFCVIAPQLRFSLDKLLVRLSSDMWREMRRARDSLFVRNNTGQEMERVRGWSKEMEASEAVFRRELHVARRETAETALSSFKPSRELEDYSTSTVSFLGARGPANVLQKDSSEEVSERQGWLFFKHASGKPVRTTWLRRWYYCRDGVFGYLIQGPYGVLQGEEIGVLLCNAKPAGQEERRFCFEVKTKSQNIMLQAETESQLMEWLEVFEAAKKRAFEASLGRDNSSLPGGSDPAFSITPPSIPEFSARLLEVQGHTHGAVTSDDLGSGFERTTTLPVPSAETHMASRSSFDLNSTLPRRALTTLAREEGETSREHAARIMQKLDPHRKGTTYSGVPGEHALPVSPGHPGGLHHIASASQISLPGPVQSGSSRPQVPPLERHKGGFLAPLTLSKPPAPTGLSKAVVAVSGERGYGTDTHKNIPTALLANYWGSSQWTSAPAASPKTNTPAQGDGIPNEPVGELVLADSDTKNTSLAGHKKTQSAGTRTAFQLPAVETQGAEVFPQNYPFELRAHHAQFRILFPGVPVEEKLVLVFRASWSSTSDTTRPGEGLSGNGRVYVTSDNMYFYGHQMGLVVAYAVPLDNISEVTAAPGKECDFIFLHLSEESNDSGLTRITIKTFLEDMDLLQARLNLLVDDLQAEEPMDTPDLINALLNMVEGEGEVHDKKSPSTESWEEVSAFTPVDDGTAGGRPVSRRTRDAPFRSRYERLRKATPKFQLPVQPVVYEPEDMHLKVSERHFEISAKACFHVLFGDKSFVFPKLYFERRAQQIAQGPWALADHGRMRREFQFKAESADILGRTKDADVVDYQIIDVFTDHVTYVVTHVKTPWHLPHFQYFKMVTKVVITHLAKSKCKLAVYTKIDWEKAPFSLSKNMVERHALADAAKDAEELADVATDQVRKLGPHSRTKRAIQVYGHVGQQTQVVVFKPDETEAHKKQTIKPRTLTTMAFETIRSFAESVVTSLVMWAFAGIRKFFRVITAHRLILALLGLSVMGNLIFTSKDRSRWWSERSAAKFMRRVGVGPNTMMSKAIYLADLDEATLGSNSTSGGETSSGPCYTTFQAINSGIDLDSPFEDAGGSMYSASSRAKARRLRYTRQKLGSYRHDLIVALRVVNNVEREMVQSEWENWLADENRRCEQVRALLYEAPVDDAAVVKAGAGEVKNEAREKPVWSGPGGDKERRLANLKEWYQDYCGSCHTEMELLSVQQGWDV